MAYPERSPIYNAYKLIVQDIIDKSVYQLHAQGAIDALNSELSGTLKEISSIMLINKEWPKNDG
jgi:hypothetical protein